MARKEIVIDDITGKEVTDAETLKVDVDGTKYAIDLTPETKQHFLMWLAGDAPYNYGEQSAPVVRVNGSNPDSSKVKQWAIETRQKGSSGKPITASTKGRLPQSVYKAYAAAHKA